MSTTEVLRSYPLLCTLHAPIDSKSCLGLQASTHMFQYAAPLCVYAVALLLPTSLALHSPRCLRADSKHHTRPSLALHAEFLSSAFWSRPVEYVDLSSSSTENTPTSMTIPLFILGGAFYPHGTTYLNVFEMKYRTMMFDISKSGDVFGYIHSDGSTGRIGSVGTLCKVTDRELLEDGRQLITIDGVSRFRVRRIVKTLPYVLADVEPDLEDDSMTEEMRAEAIRLELECYDTLKYYIRLLKTQPNYKNVVISPSACSSKPSKEANNLHDDRRRTRFTFSLAGMIAMANPRESQLLLQCTNAIERLSAEKEILNEAAEVLSDKLISVEKMTADQRDELKLKSFNSLYEEDVVPLQMDVVDVLDDSSEDEWDISNIE